ncbi:hypothetical protein WA158_000229 [Blastocystis sp. Blastoise]
MKEIYLLLLLLLIIPCFSQTSAGSECRFPSFYSHIEFQYGGNANKETINLYKGTLTDRGYIYTSFYGSGKANKKEDSYYCLEPAVYTIISIDTEPSTLNQSWFIFSANGKEKLRDYFDGAEINNLIDETDAWKYSAVPQTTTEWTKNAINDDSWISYTPGNFPNTPVGTARYYVTSFDNNGVVNDYPFFTFAIKSNEGLIAYINGKEIYRFNMEEKESVSPTDIAMSDSYDEQFRIVNHVIEIFFKYFKKIVLAVEIHPVNNGTEHADSFSSYLILNNSDVPKAYTQDGTVSSNPDATGDEAKEMAFDDDIYTKWLSKPFDGTNSITYTYNNGRAEFINLYSVTSANDAYTRDPVSFRLEGSIDGIHWHIIDTQYSNYFTSRYARNTYFLYSNRNAYNQYKLTILSIFYSSAEMTQLSEIEFNVLPRDISSGLRYGRSTYTFAYNFDTIEIYPVSSGHNNFTSNIELPHGITLDPDTGIITGDNLIYNTQLEVIISATNIFAGVIESTTIIIILTDYAKNRIEVLGEMNASTSWQIYLEFQIYDSNDAIVLAHATYHGGIEEGSCTLSYGDYKLKLLSTNLETWERLNIMTLYITMKYGGRVIFFRDSFRYEASELLCIHVSSDMLYSNVNSISRIDGIIPDNWYSTTYNPDLSEWNVNHSMYHRPSMSSRLSLTRRIIQIDTIPYATDLKILLHICGGSIVYWNGEEISRDQLPSGTITSSTTTTSTSLDYGEIYIYIPIWKVNKGNNVLAFLNVLPQTISLPTLFKIDCAYLFVYESKQYALKYEASVAASLVDSGTSDANLIDGMAQSWSATYWQTKDITTWIHITYNSNVFVFINKYCLRNNNDIIADPIEWTFHGCDYDGNNCVLLDSETNVHWNDRFENKCFYTILHIKSYSSYKLFLTRVFDGRRGIKYSLSEINFYDVNASSIVINPLSYPEDTLLGAKYVYLKSSTPTSGYKNFFIQDGYKLPSGLFIDSSDGVIHGTPTEVTDGEITIMVGAYTVLDEYSSTSITISISPCPSPNIPFTIVVNHDFDGFCSLLKYIFYESESGKVIDEIASRDQNYINTFYYCLPPMKYSLRFEHERGYCSGSIGTTHINAKVSLDDGTILVDGDVYTYERRKTFLFDNILVSHTFLDNWVFLNSNSIESPVDNSWTLVDYSTTGWSTGNRKTFGSLQGITQYYRNAFEINDLLVQHSIRYTISLNSGYIIYLNGIEIYRDNMPEGNITSSTLSTRTSTDIYTTGETISTQFNMGLVTGTNIFAIEVHKGSTNSTENTFTFLCFINNDNQYLTVDGNAYACDYYYTNQPYMCFDNDSSTKWYSTQSCLGNCVSYFFNNYRREFITSYSITNANDANDRHPSGWNVEGSNDGGRTWDIIQKKSNIFFTEFSQTFTFEMIPAKSYHAYRIFFTQCDNKPLNGQSESSGAQLAVVGFYAKILKGLCSIPDGNFNSLASGDSYFKPCPKYYTRNTPTVCINGTLIEDDNCTCILNPITTLQYPKDTFLFETRQYYSIEPKVDSTALTFSITPDLPEGLSLDPSTGIISGTPTKSFSNQLFHITATNSASVTYLLHIDVTDPYCPEDGIWPVTRIGTTVHITCPIGMISHATRYCHYDHRWWDVKGGSTECSPIVCEKDTVDNILYNTTSIGYFATSRCDSDTTFGYNTRYCKDTGDYTPVWDAIDTSMCYVKEKVEPGQSRVELKIPLQNVTSTEDPNELCYYGACSAIKAFPYQLSSLVVITNVNQISPLETSSSFSILLGTNSENFNSNIQNNLGEGNNHLLKVFKTNSKKNILSSLIGDRIENTIEKSEPVMCPSNNFVSTPLNVYEYAPISCSDTTTVYPLYQCQQNQFKHETIFINYMKCPPPSTISYISYQLIIEGINTQKLFTSSYISIYRAILQSTNVIIEHMYLTTYEDINSNKDASIYFAIQTISSNANEDANILKNLDDTQIQNYKKTLSSSISGPIKVIRINTNVMNTAQRRLRTL